jgi:hypothetical protein
MHDRGIATPIVLSPVQLVLALPRAGGLNR